MSSDRSAGAANLCAFAAPELQFQVEKLLARYVHCIDSDALEDLPAFFTEDCLYKVISRENVERGYPVAAIYCDSRAMLVDRIVSLRNANIYQAQSYRHIVSSTLISPPEGDSVQVVSNYAVYRTQNDGRTEIYNTGCYRDRILLRDGNWLFAEKQAVFDTHLIDTLMVIPI